MTLGTRRWVGLAITAGFFAVVIWLLQRELRSVDVREVLAVLREIPAGRIALALLLTAASYALAAGYDRLGTRYAGVRLRAALGMPIAFVSYAFNFNIGAIVGGIGFRLRLYARHGVRVEQVAAIVACSIVTNWCGCLSVLGATLIADPGALRAVELSPPIVRLLGGLALSPVAAYLLATLVRRRPVFIRGQRYAVPKTRFALAQIAIAGGFWLLVPGVFWLLQPGSSLRYPEVVAAYGLAALSGVVVRVPAGLGVIEAVFLESFHGALGAGAILGWVIAWRAVFLLAPLAIAALVLLVLESRSRRASDAPAPAFSPDSTRRAPGP